MNLTLIFQHLHFLSSKEEQEHSFHRNIGKMHAIKPVRRWALQEKCKPLKEKLQFIVGFCKVGLRPMANFQKKTCSLWSNEALYLAQGCAGWPEVSLWYLNTTVLFIIPDVLWWLLSHHGVQDSICEDKAHAEHASPSLHPAPDLSCQCSGERNSALLPYQPSSASSIMEIVQSPREIFTGICCMQIAAK